MEEARDISPQDHGLVPTREVLDSSVYNAAHRRAGEITPRLPCLPLSLEMSCLRRLRQP